MSSNLEWRYRRGLQLLPGWYRRRWAPPPYPHAMAA
jgi:hypothetical protein